MTMPPDVQLIECKAILSKTGGFLDSYTHTLNPYAGCAFGANGCGVYCYVAESPIGRLAGAPWGSWVRAKINAGDRLRAELTGRADRQAMRVFMSSATDPFQPAEAPLAITRQLLTVFRELPIGLLVVQTRSPLVERDYDLLREMPFVWLSMTVETDDDAVRRALTPTCPGIGRRFRAMRLARQQGIRVQAAVSPVLPHNPARFAPLLAEAADRVVIDTFEGDGACGQRTARRPLPQRYRQLGWGDWRDQVAAQSLYRALGEQLGHERVGWSRAGFNNL